MKRTELKRKTELKPSGKPLRDYATSTMRRYARLRPRSAKTEKIYREERRPLVERLLAERPACQRCDCARSTEVHEPGLRSRGADITNPDECVVLCHSCHRWIHDNPAAATDEGWMRSSWTPPEGVA